MISDPNEEDLIQIVIDLVTGEWRPLALNFTADDEEADPSDYFAEPLDPPGYDVENETLTRVLVDRNLYKQMPKEGFV